MATYSDRVVWTSWVSLTASNYHDLSTAVTENTWSHWNSDTPTAVTGAWYHWNTCTGTGSTVSANDDVVWGSWNRRYAAVESVSVVRACDFEGFTAKERHRNKRRKRRRDAVAVRRKIKLQRKRIFAGELREREKKQAEDRASQLLLDLIGKVQYQIYEKTGKLLVHGRKHDWLIHKYGRVHRLEKDRVIDLCVHLRRKWEFPSGDNVIAMALAAHSNEKKLVQLAHITGEQSKFDVFPECAVMGGSDGR